MSNINKKTTISHVIVPHIIMSKKDLSTAKTEAKCRPK